MNESTGSVTSAVAEIGGNNVRDPNAIDTDNKSFFGEFNQIISCATSETAAAPKNYFRAPNAIDDKNNTRGDRRWKKRNLCRLMALEVFEYSCL